MGRVVLTALLSAGLASASTPIGHTISYTPRAGDVNTTFVFTGRSWQPEQRVTANYYLSASAPRLFRSYSFVAGAGGGFRFEFTKPVGLVEAGVTAKMCFRQRDTSTKPHRTFRKCSNFYVAPPSAQFQPSSGTAGQAFVLVVSGFLGGRRLEGTLTPPTGEATTFTVRTRTADAFVSGGPFGPIYVRRGGGVAKFVFGADDPIGLYSALVLDPRAGHRARAALVLAE
jgi:hypothetical protein